jgi:hypothetical protein
MKLYNEEEIGAILKKATEPSGADGVASTVGLTIDELRQLGADAGIDPDRITRAVSEIAVGSDSTEWTLLGGPFSFNKSIVLDREITAGQWEDMLASIRACFKAKGDVSVRESAFEWSSPWDSANSGQVTATRDQGKTKVNVGWNGPLTAFLFYLPVIPVAILSVFIASDIPALTEVTGLSLVALMSVGTFAAGRWALGRYMDKLFGKFRGLMAGFEGVPARSAASTGTAAPQADSLQSEADSRGPLLDLEPGEGLGEGERVEGTRIRE